ncbi:MAG: AAA family ATPase, partial [Planctomycetota bacterium]|nr:AAA family ATPase [Planctomycetota bacterium]
MQATGTDIELRGRILRARGRVVVLTGPAACGKTDAAMGLYEHYAAERAAGCVLIAPTAGAAAAMRSRLLARAGGVLAGPRILTFVSLAEGILAAAGTAARVISPFRRQLLLQRIVDELAAGRKLSALGAVADAPGLIVALDRSIAELKRAAVEPEALARAVGEAPGKARDLLEVYRRYQQALRAEGLYDLEGRMWEARDRLAAIAPGKPLPGLEGVRALAVDGFTDFTPTQLQILRHAAGSLERVLITLPYVEDSRVRLWHWTHRTLNAIRPAFGADLEEIALTPARENPGCEKPGCRGLRR